MIEFFGDVAAALRTLAAERDQLRRALSDAHRAQGEAEGKLAASEMAGVVERWKERAERVEVERDELRALVPTNHQTSTRWTIERDRPNEKPRQP